MGKTLAAMAMVAGLCGPQAAKAQRRVEVSVGRACPVVIQTPAAKFELAASGYLRGWLVKDGRRLTLDDPAPGEGGAGDLLTSDGKTVDFAPFDCRRAKITDVHGGIGPGGRRVELVADGPAGLRKSLTLEVYENFPAAAFLTLSYRNSGAAPVRLDRVAIQRRRLNASLAAPQQHPYEMWTFHGSSYKWGEDDVRPIVKDFKLDHPIGPASNGRLGGGLPVVAFWTRQVGTAMGYAEPRPYTVSLPVEVAGDERVSSEIRIANGAVLKPGEIYATPRSFLAVFTGDYYEPLSMWSAILQHQGWTPAQPGSESYEANWCGWGYLGSVTALQMLGTIPKLKEFGLKWATLDSGWFDNHGDWNPNPQKFPGDSLRRLVDEFHGNGIRITVWWYPLAADAGQANGKRAGRASKVLEEHPDWAILDAGGNRGRQVMLCPAVPAVQEYFRRVTEKLIRDYDFDGHKFDGVYSVAPCYNPAHHHQSPDESVQAMGEVYKIIFDTTRALKPYSVTQTCPCGTTPNMAWLPFLDQAVTADPVGSVQVRRRIKLYKALLGPRSAVYGDHVELSRIVFDKGNEIDLGEDFASTIGPGGVVGTKFTWPDYGSRFAEAFLTPRKEEKWRKWIAIYNSKMLSKGTFRNLYEIGYDSPEGYAIAKDGKMYYAFFADSATPAWKGTLELRGLAPGRYRVFDYVNEKELGTVDAANPRLATEFQDQLLVELARQ